MSDPGSWVPSRRVLWVLQEVRGYTETAEFESLECEEGLQGRV